MREKQNTKTIKLHATILCGGFEILETITLRFESGAGLKLVDTSVHSTRYAFSGVTNNVE